MVPLAELSGSNEFLNAILDVTRDCIKVLDLDAKLIFMNRGGEEVTECDFKHIVGMNWFDFWEGDQRKSAEKEFAKALEGGTGEFIAYAPTARTQTPKWWHTVLTLIKTPDGKPSSVLAVSREITSLKAMETELKDAVRRREELLSVCSHELKTPLTLLRLQSASAKKRITRSETVIEAPAMAKVIGDFERQIDRLSRLVDDMLDLTRIRTGKLRLAREEVKLSSLIYEVLERFSDQLSASGCEVVVKAAPGIVGQWDRFRIEQILINLLTNAMKYGANQPIEIHAARDKDSSVTLTVKDGGRGIAKEDQERIFQRYERALAANEVSGLGLGLFIVKQIVEAHAGSIQVQSQKGVGSVFTVTLPLN